MSHRPKRELVGERSYTRRIADRAKQTKSYFARLRCNLGSGALLIEREQAGEDFVVGQHACAPVVAPAIGVGDSGIERGVGVAQPLRAGVVEVGQRALLQFLRGLSVLGQDAVGIAGDDSSILARIVCSLFLCSGALQRILPKIDPEE